MTSDQISLSLDQARAFDAIMDWFAHRRHVRREFTLAGLAGTGKTTIVSRIVLELEAIGSNVMTLAPTGKAAQVLREKGRNADTIHAAIYLYRGQYEDDKGRMSPIFMDRDELDQRPDLIVVDEASMVNTSVYADLVAFGIPVLWVGDHGQLPPVGGDPELMRSPDVALEKIHRQAADSGIIRLAHDLRNGYAQDADRYGAEVSMKPWRKYYGDLDPAADQLICSFNRTRVRINRHIRSTSGHGAQPLQDGETIICLKNNRHQFLFNGMQFFTSNVTTLGDHHYVASLTSRGTGMTWDSIRLRKEFFHSERPDIGNEIATCEIAADFGYCITCHKSQGSEFDRVCVIYQPCAQWDNRRWTYTAATRAREHLCILGLDGKL